MLFFFNGNLNTGLQNEVLAQKCNDKLKVRLFQISDEEIVKFYESANLLYEKYRDPSVFGDLNATIAGSIEFRENVGLKNSGALDEIRQKLTTQVATPIDLISNYLLEIYQNTSYYNISLYFNSKITSSKVSRKYLKPNLFYIS